MSFFTTKAVAIVAAILLALVGGWGVWNYLKVANAEATATKAVAERDEAGVARDKAIEAAKASQVAIEQLQKEKADIQLSLNSLEADKKRNQQVITNLSTAIRATSNDPLNQVTLSPVLKATVDSIQRQRAAREGAQP